MTRIAMITVFVFGALSVDRSETAAGPPLVCRQLEIGPARSLPWKEGPFGLDPEFKPEHVSTEAPRILSESEDAVVHMETLRRAYLYLGIGSDHGGLTALGASLKDRIIQTVADEATPVSRSSTLAWFDLAYLMAIIENNGGPDIIPNRTSVRLLQHVAARAPMSPDLQFGVGYALVGNRHLDGEKNLKLAAQLLTDSHSLVARNLSEAYRAGLAESRPGLVPEPELNPRPIGQPLPRTVFIRMDEAKKQFDLGVQFFDARVKAVFDAAHIKGAFNLDPTDAAIVAARSVPPALDRFDRAKTVVVYDDGGDCDAAQLISIQLRKFGFTDVKVFEEGLAAWKSKGHLVEATR